MAISLCALSIVLSTVLVALGVLAEGNGNLSSLSFSAKGSQHPTCTLAQLSFYVALQRKEQGR